MPSLSKVDPTPRWDCSTRRMISSFGCGIPHSSSPPCPIMFFLRRRFSSESSATSRIGGPLTSPDAWRGGLGGICELIYEGDEGRWERCSLFSVRRRKPTFETRSRPDSGGDTTRWPRRRRGHHRRAALRALRRPAGATPRLHAHLEWHRARTALEGSQRASEAGRPNRCPFLGRRGLRRAQEALVRTTRRGPQERVRHAVNMVKPGQFG